MAEDFAAQLDVLMGADRNGDVEIREYHYDDTEVCRSFLLRMCGSDLFSNTKVDPGPCGKVHDDKALAEYEALSESMRQRLDYSADVERSLRQLISDIDRRVAKNKERLTVDQKDDTPEMIAKGREIEELAISIGNKTSEIEKLGAEGEVEKSMALLDEVEKLKLQKGSLDDQYQRMSHASHASGGSTNQQQKLRVCDVCAAFLSIFDSDQRLADHFGGKLHLGYLAVREKLAEMAAAKSNRSRGSGSEREGRSRSRSRSPRRSGDRRRSVERDNYRRDNRHDYRRSDYYRRDDRRRDDRRRDDRRRDDSRRRERDRPYDREHDQDRRYR